MTEITSSINSRVRLWKITHLGPGCSFDEFYEWYIFQKNTHVNIINVVMVSPGTHLVKNHESLSITKES